MRSRPRQIEESAAAFTRAATWRAGTIDRPAPYWRDYAGDLDRVSEEQKGVHLLLHRGADVRVDGAASDRVAREKESGTCVVSDLFAADPIAEAALIRFLCEIDLVDEVRIDANAPNMVPIALLTAPRAATSGPLSDDLHVRIHDVPAAFSARSYPLPGTLVLEVTDPYGQGAGRFVIEATPGGNGNCEPTTAKAELEISIELLGSLWLADRVGSSLGSAVGSGRATVTDARVLERASALLGWPIGPFALTDF